MLENIKLFATSTDRSTYEDSEDYIEPYVSLVEGDNTVHYNKEVVETRLIATYNVEDTSNPTPLFVGAESIGFPASAIYDKIEIDNVEIDMSDLLSLEQGGRTKYGYVFESNGQHTVKYTLKDPTMIGVEFDEQWTITRLGATFAQCPNIISVEIPNSVTSIGGGAFSECDGLASVTIGNNVTSIGNSAFQGCGGLTSVTIPDSVTSIGDAAFHSCHQLASCEIGSGVTNMGERVFEDCINLTNVTIHSTIIGEHTFSNCTSLLSITIPNSVTSIGDYAFASCSALTSVTIGSSVTSIGDYVFKLCNSLTSITSLATTAPTITSYTFEYIINNGTLTVPSGSSGYDVWMGTDNYYLGKYNWTKVEQ